MAENKTNPTDISVEEFLTSVGEERRREAQVLITMMQEASGEAPVMWGPSMIGFGSYHYRYSSGREGDALKIGFSPRKATIALYGLVQYDEVEKNNELLELLGKHKRGKGCLYLTRLSDANIAVLKQMIQNGYH